MSILIKNGYVLDPSSGFEGKRDIFIKRGIIKEVAADISEDAEQVIDAEGMYVMPGFIDLHVHLREPGYEYKETIATGSMAAARGGFTSICPMPNTNPTIDNHQMIEYLLLKAKKEASVNILPIGAITKGQQGHDLADFEGMANLLLIFIVSTKGSSVSNSTELGHTSTHLGSISRLCANTNFTFAGDMQPITSETL